MEDIFCTFWWASSAIPFVNTNDVAVSLDVYIRFPMYIIVQNYIDKYLMNTGWLLFLCYFLSCIQCSPETCVCFLATINWIFISVSWILVTFCPFGIVHGQYFSDIIWSISERKNLFFVVYGDIMPWVLVKLSTFFNPSVLVKWSLFLIKKVNIS